MINDFWKNPKVTEYLFYDFVGIDRIVEKYGECTNDYVIKIEYMIVDIMLQLKKDIVIDITREEYDNFIEVPQRIVSRWHSLEYDEFKDVFNDNLFNEDLKLHIVPNIQSDFLLLVNETFYNFNFESQAKIFFRELISYLTRCNHLLNQNDAVVFEKNPIQEIVSNIYSENYLDTIQKIKNNYKLIFPEIENNFGVDFDLIETYSTYRKMNKFQELNEIKTHTEIIKNPYINIFTNDIAFSIFEKLHSIYKDSKTRQADYSFIFYSMKKDYLTCSNIEFVKFLSETYKINIDKIDSRYSGKSKKTQLYNAIKDYFLSK